MRRAEMLVLRAAEALPELRPALERCLAENIDPDDTDDESRWAAYHAYGTVVFPFLLGALASGRERDVARVCELLEALATSGDAYWRSVVTTDVLYPLVGTRWNVSVRRWAGPATLELLESQERMVSSQQRGRRPVDD